MPPTIGRIVHYYHPSQQWAEGARGPLAALIVDIYESEVTLVWFDRYGDRHVAMRVPYDENRTPGTWSWPPRVDEGSR